MTHERVPSGEQPTAFEQHAEQIGKQPLPPSGNVFVEHASDIQPKLLASEEDLKRGLWQQLVDARAAGNLSLDMFAARLGLSRQRVHELEHMDPTRIRLSTLRKNLAALEGWVEAFPPSGDALKRDLWQQLIDARAAGEMSLAEFGARFGVSRSLIYRMEHTDPAHMRLSTLQKYLAALEGWAEQLPPRQPVEEAPGDDLLDTS